MKEAAIRDRIEKKIKKAKIVPIPDNQDEFIDANLKEPETNDETEFETPVTTISTEDFTILGNDHFEKKTKVFIVVSLVA